MIGLAESEGVGRRGVLQVGSLLRARLRDPVELRHGLLRQLQFRHREVVAQMRQRSGAGDEEYVGRAAQEPGEGHLHRRGGEAGGDRVELRRFKRPVRGRV